MSTDFQLKTIYKRVPVSEDIDPECPSVTIDYTSDSSAGSVDTPFISENKKDVKEEYFCRRFCKILLVIIGLYLLFITCFSLASAYFALHRFNACFHSPYNKVNDYIFEAESVKAVDFSVVTGSVVVKRHSLDTVEVRVTTKAKHEHLIDETLRHVVKLSDDGVLRVISNGPSFDYSTCRLTDIMIFLPEEYDGKIDVIGNINTGAAYVHADEMDYLHDLILNVEVGYTFVEDLYNAATVEIGSRLGLVTIVDSNAKNIKTNIGVGFQQIYRSMAMHIEALTDYGMARVVDTHTESQKVQTHWGSSSVIMPQSNSIINPYDLKVHTEYGRTFVEMSADLIPSSKILVKSKVGTYTVDFNENSCRLENHEGELLNDSFTVLCQNNMQVTEGKSANAVVSSGYGSSTAVIVSEENEAH